MRVVVDTNVLISALLKADSGPAKIVAMWHAGDVEVVVSTEIIAEITRVLAYPKISARVAHEDAVRFITLLQSFATVVEVSTAVTAVDADPDDDKFVALALASGAAYVISGDRHLLDVRALQGIGILAPAQFLALMMDSSENQE